MILSKAGIQRPSNISFDLLSPEIQNSRFYLVVACPLSKEWKSIIKKYDNDELWVKMPQERKKKKKRCHKKKQQPQNKVDYQCQSNLPIVL